jgi:hypothetical protein
MMFFEIKVAIDKVFTAIIRIHVSAPPAATTPNTTSFVFVLIKAMNAWSGLFKCFTVINV